MKTINGQKLKEMFISGSNSLYNHYPEVDALNVFPVPDGDTGMNMNLTMTSGSKEIQNRTDTNIYEIGKAFSRGLLMGARGNSGVITSQIFRGFAQGLEGKEEIDVVGLSDAFEKGVQVAYKAVIKPVEGTILTVVKDSSKYLRENIKKATSIVRALEILIEEAERSLQRTPDLLPILKEVGVVDSGGQGLIYIFKGMLSAAQGAVVERNQATETDPTSPIIAAGAAMEEEEFGYCTEFIMELGPDSTKKPFNEKRFTNVLLSRGNSLVVVRDENIVKVHVHTLNPGIVLNYAQQFGEFLKLKIENMTEQHHALANGAQVEAHTDLVEEPKKAREHSKNAVIAVSSGKGIDEFFTQICDAVIVGGGQTMNPSAEDFIQAIKEANADNIFILPNNSNIVMAASQAAKMAKDCNVTVIPTKTIPQGLSAAIMYNPEGEVEDNIESMSEARENVKSGEVTFSIRDTSINGLKINKDDFMGIFEKDIVVSSKDKKEVLYGLLEKMVSDDNSVITLITGEDVDDALFNEIKEYVENTYDCFDIDLRKGLQPVYSFLIGVE